MGCVHGGFYFASPLPLTTFSTQSPYLSIKFYKKKGNCYEC